VTAAAEAVSVAATPYAGSEIALLTRHGKERVIIPVFRDVLGAAIQLDFGYDTDVLGTFTREIPRLLSQREAAARKARLAIERSGLPVGLGSEGAFGPDPVAGLSPWNLELLVLVDAGRGIEVTGMAQGPANFAHQACDAWTDVEAFAHAHDFPLQHLVLRPADVDDARIYKDIASWPALYAAYRRARRAAENHQVVVETDGRAFANPQRMARIGEAAQDLANRLRSCCPACAAPGFGRVERIAGLACAACGSPTSLTRAEVHGCTRCAHRTTVAVGDGSYADPTYCDDCNP
jgi:hypothetical protein